MTWPTIDTVSTSISGINSGFFALPSTDPTPDSFRILYTITPGVIIFNPGALIDGIGVKAPGAAPGPFDANSADYFAIQFAIRPGVISFAPGTSLPATILAPPLSTASMGLTPPIIEDYRILRKSLYSDLFLGELYMQPADRFLVGTYTETTLEGIDTTEIDTTDISFAIGLNMAYSIVIPSGPSLYTFWS